MKQQERSSERASSSLTVLLILFLIKRLSIKFTKCAPQIFFGVPLRSFCAPPNTLLWRRAWNAHDDK